MRTTLEVIEATIDAHLAKFSDAGEDLAEEHEFIANFVGNDAVLCPTYEDLLSLGFTGDAPDGTCWIYMHVRRPLTRDAVLTLAQECNDIADRHGSEFELLDVSWAKNTSVRGKLTVLGVVEQPNGLRSAE